MLPKMGTPEWETEKLFFMNSSQEERQQRAEKLGMNPISYHKRMNERGITLKGATPPIEPNIEELESTVLQIVKGGAVSVGEISRRVDRSAETVIRVIDTLREKNYEVVLNETTRQVTIPDIPSKTFEPTKIKYYKHYYKVGIVSDTQICSKYQQLTLLHDAYKDFDNKQVDFILHSGDVVDGMNMYRGHVNEVFKHGVDEQEDYVVKNYPYSKRKTYLIGGQHDACFFKQNGRNILEGICKKRDDLVYRGFWSAQFDIKGLQIGLHHPGGGVPYARSYRLQKYIENMMGYITSIPSAVAPIIQLFGHWHIPCHLPQYMGVDAVSLPCFQMQTPYMAEKGLMPVVGYAIAEIYLDDNNNLTSVKIEFVNQNAHIIEKDY